MDQPDRIEIALFTPSGHQAVASSAGRPPETESIDPPLFHLRWSQRGLASVFGSLKRLIRPLVVALYLAPALILVKVVFHVFDLPGGDWITVGFVGLALLFFFILAVLVLMFPIVGPRSRRRIYPDLQLDRREMAQALRQLSLGDLPETTTEQLVQQLESTPPGERTGPLRLRGRARAAGDQDSARGGGPPLECGPSAREKHEDLMSEWWLAGDQSAVRLVTASTFALAIDGPQVVVDPSQGPWLLARHDARLDLPELEPGLKRDLEQWMTQNTNLPLERLVSKGQAARLPAGAEVEIVAPGGAEVVENIDELVVAGRRLDLGGEAAALRAGPANAPSELLVSDRGMPARRVPATGRRAPYRRDQVARGLLLRGTYDAPLVIRVR